MHSATWETPIMAEKYDVQISGVHEVSLVGTADLAPWQSRLASYDLSPTEKEGRAELLISGCEGRFKGIRFRELTISIFVSDRPDRSTRDGIFMIHAFNSLRFFAFVERTFFHTPYYYAGIKVETGPPARIEMFQGGAVGLRFAMAGDAAKDLTESRAPTSVGPAGWEGPIHLPRKRAEGSEPLRLFHGKLTGVTHSYPFAASDTWSLSPMKQAPALKWLLESRFEPQEWVVRPNATHGKSKTLIRSMPRPTAASES
jgi:hypothetical protein